jgi:hypothetical protein
VSVFDRLVLNQAAHLLPGGTPERQFIQKLRKALREYDRATKPDLRRNNGRGHRVDPEVVKKAVGLVGRGRSIRQAAKEAGTSYGTVWLALQRATTASRPRGR